VIDLLTARARNLHLKVNYVSVIGFGGVVQEGKLGGWDRERGEIQVLAREKGGRVFVLAHELMHAELADAYEDRPADCSFSGTLEGEEVIHSATESCLEALGVQGYREFCMRTGRGYRSLAQLQAEAPQLGRLSAWLADLCFGVWQMDVVEAIEAGEI
jgi:hypothetical protein